MTTPVAQGDDVKEEGVLHVQGRAARVGQAPCGMNASLHPYQGRDYFFFVEDSLCVFRNALLSRNWRYLSNDLQADYSEICFL